MSGNTNIDRKTVRRQAVRAEIVTAAWELVAENGLAGLAMRDLGERVGMRAQSIYSYFGSKHEIYDAMFAEGYRTFIAWMDEESDPNTIDPADTVRRAAHRYVEFCTVDPVRHQLLFQRTIPGFEPSDESYELAIEAYDRMRDPMAAVGARDQDALDLSTAVLSGLASQQIANDPGGNRWKRLVDRAVDMLLEEANAPTTQGD